ncbi:Molybdopterin converting factor, small subunit [Enhygromyxa salina]|uniref:Molybdopterin converting factor, small subunit n=1 Tax=Enhygromyxa salina TaxID=215803 RepID=A0A0C2DFT0_9BACT|nr:MoaD/ThiS family protein [Enhygromyxa salina]KIG18492.1 Molybdopterin converting factor, small subunit [Enhygromyxa salina]
MPTVNFTANLQRHVVSPTLVVEGVTVGEALAAVFEQNPRLRGYVVDEQGAVRKHMNVFIDGVQVRDRVGLSDAVTPQSEIYVIQALSGG